MADFVDRIAQHIPRLRRYARALTHDAAWADDLVQDTLERALRRRWLYRFDRSLAAWLFTILYRLFLDDAARRGALVPIDMDAPEPAGQDDPAVRIDMQRALARLPAEQRAVVVLIGLEQLSYNEAAAVLGVPPGTVMSRLSRARAQLRQLLSGEPVAGAGDGGTSAARLSRIK
ncbi:MAG TPA: RNA polymerase sigma factor [Noviherbaspirillum sp.]|uniref:RNA polymerase sigma factor n=1 Tax=Noviherbaspirillum sp. TaxID=1926288 RepID=UPI002D6872A9|nr:RNA polymerase sigma factor [Noviherbaspirillum sp.]HYD94288.1 RNA polymerase sigma factor [Noviherbaspirillum sp.]